MDGGMDWVISTLSSPSSIPISLTSAASLLNLAAFSFLRASLAWSLSPSGTRLTWFAVQDLAFRPCPPDPSRIGGVLVVEEEVVVEEEEDGERVMRRGLGLMGIVTTRPAGIK